MILCRTNVETKEMEKNGLNHLDLQMDGWAMDGNGFFWISALRNLGDHLTFCKRNTGGRAVEDDRSSAF